MRQFLFKVKQGDHDLEKFMTPARIAFAIQTSFDFRMVPAAFPNRAFGASGKHGVRLAAVTDDFRLRNMPPERFA